jgi:FlaA1/EpsC-like NDP-sugar epimerase
MFNLDVELGAINHNTKLEYIIGDVTAIRSIENVFKIHQPELVFHVAAYKHVPLMEENPLEAIRNNVIGTKIVAELASQYRASKFVFISTDKAVNPTNVMGASKRIAEIFVQSLNKISPTSYITTRFGNVLGSNGSVVPTFDKQIECGGPVTITHPDVTRYFMTIPEASQLVLEACACGKGGEIFVFDMGESVRILDLAKNMIRLAGFIPEVDIKIAFTGLRPGEKLYEELLHSAENTMPTHHPKLMIAKVREYDYSLVLQRLTNMEEAIYKQNVRQLVREMKRTVPEFISQNSVFEEIDRELKIDDRHSSLKAV